MISDVHKIETKNARVRVLEYPTDTDEVNIIYSKDTRRCASTLNLVLIPKENGGHHYPLITDFNRFIGRRSKNIPEDLVATIVSICVSPRRR